MDRDAHRTADRRGWRSRALALALVAGGAGLMGMLGCNPAPATNLPTVEAVRTEVRAAAKGQATLSATAQAVATRVAPTVQAIALTAAPIGTSVALSPVHITDVKVNPNDTTITVRNSGQSLVNLERWTLLLGPSIAITLRDIGLEPGQTRTLNLASGTDTPENVYLDSSSGGVVITFAPGESAVLVEPNHAVASVFKP